MIRTSARRHHSLGSPRGPDHDLPPGARMAACPSFRSVFFPSLVLLLVVALPLMPSVSRATVHTARSLRRQMVRLRHPRLAQRPT
ncbi:hypothetical protein F5883DRAFT_162986 [Diaporthe sp. PMI_573]|nr:hypothetical protein F5883DRAFT_162986 [Diaporthaceae sp. PMI_573]